MVVLLVVEEEVVEVVPFRLSGQGGFGSSGVDDNGSGGSGGGGGGGGGVTFSAQGATTT